MIGLNLLNKLRHVDVIPRVNILQLVVPFTLGAICVAAYGVFTSWFGLYGNDLPYLYHYHLFGPTGPAGFAALDRPYSAWVYALITYFFGETVWYYHVFHVFLRWLSGWLLWMLLGRVLPNNPRLNLAAAILFVIYPSFMGQPIAVEFILHFMVLDMTLASLILMLYVHSFSTKNTLRDGIFTALGLVGAASIFSLEYFIGLEALRPFLLGMVISKKEKRTLPFVRLVVRGWLPYLMVVIGFLVWRVFIFQFPTYKPVWLSGFSQHPFQSLVDLVISVISSLKVVLLEAWEFTLVFPTQPNVLLRFLILSGLAFLLTLAGWYLIKVQDKNDHSKADEVNRPIAYMFLGLLALATAGVPFWITGIPVRLDFPWDRSTLPFMLGGSLLAAGLVAFIVQPRIQAATFALLIGLAVGQHYINAMVYRAEWEKLRSFIWQMTWRIPEIKPGTLVLFDDPPLNRYSDTDLTTVLNWTYTPDSRSRDLPFKFFDLHIRMDTGYVGLPGLEEGLTVRHDHRSLRFTGNTSQMLVIDYRPPGCFRLLMPGDQELPGLSAKLAKTIHLSKPELMNTRANPPAVPPSMFFPEPKKTWCYYFQKADLARQEKDWLTLVKLGNTAFDLGLKPSAASEIFPFIEGYSHQKDWRRVNWLFDNFFQPDLMPAACVLLDRLSKDIDLTTSDLNQVRAIQSKVKCKS